MDRVPIGSPAGIEFGEGRCDYLTAQALVRWPWWKNALWYVSYLRWRLTMATLDWVDRCVEKVNEKVS